MKDDINAHTLFMLGSTHRTAPLDVREQFSVSEEKEELLYEELQGVSGIEEVLILNTCNRIELYCVSEPTFNPRGLSDVFCRINEVSVEAFERHSVWAFDEDVIQHLFEVASGIDSQMVGETEILGQVKEAYNNAKGRGALGFVLNRVFQKSFQAAKWTRTHTYIGKGQVSIGNVAAEFAVRIFGKLSSVRILMVGIGEAGEKALMSLKSRGANNLSVVNRTYSKACEVAEKVCGRAVPFEQLPEMLESFDIVICSTGAPSIIINREMAQRALFRRTSVPLFFIDLSVPRNICEKVASLENTYLYNLDDLACIANENYKAREAEVDKCKQFLAERAQHVWNAINVSKVRRRQEVSVADDPVDAEELCSK